MKSWLKIFIVGLALPLALSVAQEKPQKPAGKKPVPKESSPEDKEIAVLDTVPLNQPITGLRIPNFSPSGKLLMLFDAKSAQRINDRNLEMKDLKIEIHNEDGTTFHVTMSHSVFNLDTRLLTSDSRTQIRRNDFVITGEKAEFQLKSKFGRMLGPSKMIIDSDNVK